MRPSKNKPQKIETVFKDLRLKVGLSQEGLARKMGVAVSTVRRWDKGEAEPHMTLGQMKKFCQAVRIDFEVLPNKLGTTDDQ